MPLIANGWRTIVIESFDSMRVSGESILVQKEESPDLVFPLSQVRMVMITSPQGSLSLPLINALSEYHISVILCDEKHDPSCELIPLAEHNFAAGNLVEQCSWPNDRKNAVWAEIVCAKIRSQMAVLEIVESAALQQFQSYLLAVSPGDPDNREGIAAKVYFSELFGHSFIRHSLDNINAALNYGYSIIRSAMTRTVAAHGYHPALGIHHCSRSNPFNLPCDLMEPFRPIVDLAVLHNQGRILDWEYKKELIALVNATCYLDGQRMSLEYAMENYTLQILGMLSGNKPAHMIEVRVDGAA